MKEHRLVGQWRLIAYEARGSSVAPDAPAQRVGFLLYSPDGWMAEALQTRPEDGGAPTSLFYCGRYELDGDTVTHIPTFHTNSDAIGQRLARTFRIEGETRFTLIAPRPDGAVHLLWERLPG